MNRSSTKSKGKRDSQRAREQILDAAEAVFAEYGFQGARTEAISKASGYNISLLYQYFGDKLALYAEILKRTDQELNSLLVGMITPLLEDETITTDVQRLKSTITLLVNTTFDYLLDHPRLRRILTWEMAEGWQTYLKIASQLRTDEFDLFEELFERARNTGILRSDFPGIIQLTLIFQLCLSFLDFLPMYQLELPGEEIISPKALALARERLVTWTLGSMVSEFIEPEKYLRADPTNTNPNRR